MPIEWELLTHRNSRNTIANPREQTKYFSLIQSRYCVEFSGQSSAVLSGTSSNASATRIAKAMYIAVKVVGAKS